MRSFKGEPLKVTFSHHGNVTVARAKICWNNIPELLQPRFEYMFTPNGALPMSLSTKTICRELDTYDEVKGEKIARKKLIKRFMSMIRQAAEAEIAWHNNEITKIMQVKTFVTTCHDSIVKYLGEQ